MSLEKRLNVEKLISSISSRFVGKIDLNEAINKSLQDLGGLSGADRVSLFLFNGNKDLLKNTHEWCKDGIEAQLENLQDIDRTTVSWWIKQIEKLSFINIKDVSNLPNQAKFTKEFMRFQNIRSFLGFPIYHNIKIAGFVCFSKVLEEIQWKGKDFTILRIFSQILESTFERLQAENALRENQEFLSATFEAIAEGIIAIDNHGHITRINTRFVYMWRVPDEMVEILDFKLLLDCIADQLADPEIFKKKIQELRETSKNDFDMILFKDGRIFEQYSCPITLEGEIAGRLWSFRDVSEHQHAEEELKNSEKKYRNLSKQYRKAYERVDFYKDIFTHDMNNIFHNISSSAELISILRENSQKHEKIEEIFQIIDNQIDRGVMLINNVRKLSKLEDTETNLKRVNIIEVLDEAIIFANKSSQGKQIEIKYNKPEKIVTTYANEFLLDVFENILHNSIKYNRNQTVEIEIKLVKKKIEKKNFIRLEFMDNGIGIFDENKEIIFQKGHKKDKKARGMGIGLSLVKKIIKSYNGKIWVENRVKGDYTQGSNFILLIPELV
ncbi:MAG: ATP-binding protein [Promethearchaeota archaeon]